MIVHSSCCSRIFRKTTNAKILLVLACVIYNTTASFGLDPANPVARPLPVGTRVGLWLPAGPPEVEPAVGEALLHPILKTPDFHGFEGKPISPEFFKSLNSNLRLYRFAPNRYGSLAKRCNTGSFRKAELEVGQRFCDLAKGLTEAEIVGLAGRPTAMLGKVDPWKDSEEGEKNWLYFFGYQNIHIRLVFREGHCTKAMLLDFTPEYSGYEIWRAQTIAKFAIGKTREEIQQFIGEQQPVDGYEPVGKVVAYAINNYIYMPLYFSEGKCIRTGLDGCAF
jgi:hypothetical protein